MPQNEYKITLKGILPSLFNNTVTAVEVYEANSGHEAMEKARKDLKHECLVNGLDPEIDRFRIEIIDVEKL